MAVERFPIEASHIMMFARSIGDDNQIYYDADYAENSEVGAIVAPPTFVQAGAQFDPNYGLRPRSDGKGWMGSGSQPTSIVRPTQQKTEENEQAASSGGSSRGGGGGVLHAEQRYEYHRHPKVGDVLSTTSRPGKTWERQGRRSGKLVFSESITEYRDQNGELVVTATSVGVRTERAVDQS
ncbi:MAG: MaoC family dehydratase N-terminal domain-containing protein [Gammaproteobacteria bacterium]|nr:MaoC family dehydratase N-terminal domain-containing protein [Gammaproteobacteria bacterium]